MSLKPPEERLEDNRESEIRRSSPHVGPLFTNRLRPAAAGRGKGRPKADPVGTRSALPATKAAGMLPRAGEATH